MPTANLFYYRIEKVEGNRMIIKLRIVGRQLQWRGLARFVHKTAPGQCAEVLLSISAVSTVQT